jgi:hypothetical protein
MVARCFFAALHDGACGLKQCYNNQSRNASENSIETNFRQLEELCEFALG